MTERSFEHIAMFQMLDRLESLERLVETLSHANVSLYRRTDRLELEVKRLRQLRPRPEDRST